MDSSCQEGMSPQYLMNDPILSQIINWEDLLENRLVDWNDYYQTSPYTAIQKDHLSEMPNIPMYKKYNFGSYIMQRFFDVMSTDWSDVVYRVSSWQLKVSRERKGNKSHLIS